MKKGIIPLIKIAAILLTGTVALTACHKTPSTPPVVGKNNGVLEKAIGETVPKGRYNAPQTWKATYTHGKLTVNIDATIETPDINEYPVLQVAPDALTQDKVNNLVKVLMQGKTIYPIRDTSMSSNGDDMTKSEILQEIADLEAGTNSGMKASDPAEYAKEIQPQVASLKAKLASAPDTIEQKPSDGKLTAIVNPVIALQELENWEGGDTSSADDDTAKYPDYMGLNVEADVGKPNPATLTIQKSPDDTDDKITFNGGIIANKSWQTTADPPKLTITSDQGADVARKAIADLGLTNMKLAVTTQSQDKYAYYFTHTVQGLPMNYAADPINRFRMGGASNTAAQQSSSSSSQSGGSQDDLSYAEPWPNETLEIDVDDGGVTWLYWNCPEKIGKTITKNVAVLPFDQLEQIFAKDMEYEGVFTGIMDSSVVARTVNITKISLGLVKIPVKDHPGTYMLVPAWDFYGSCSDKEAADVQDPNLNANHELVYNTFYTSYATINAIDGTLIDRTNATNMLRATNQISASK
jgi:hypothetical protein